MTDCKIIMVQPQPTAVIRANASMDEMLQAQKAAREKIDAALPTLNAGSDGYPCTLWRMAAGGKMAMEFGVIVTQAFKSKGDVQSSELPGGRVVHYVARGPYEGVPAAWKTVMGWIEQRNLRAAGPSWGIYGDDHPDPAKLKTQLYVLLK